MNLFIKIFLGCILSFFLFPFGLSFFPDFVNLKMILAVLGVIAFLMNNISLSGINVNYNLLASFCIASIFSCICYYSAFTNNTSDYSYATYISSFLVWLFAAYFISWCFRVVYKDFSFRQLAYYLIAICLTQCILAFLIDTVPVVKSVVDAYVVQGQEFYNSVDRLYGIGAALDSAGIRFSVVLIICAALLVNDEDLKSNRGKYFRIVFCFFLIGIIGNMISRTTIVGFGIGFAYILYGSGIFRTIIKVNSFKNMLILLFVLMFIVVFVVYVYISSAEYRESLRFAFEGFFNWVETGVWRTGSTDKLNREMWIWPDDTKTWIIGSGLFGNFIFSTDVGYCRFILYSGIVGFSTFALLFVYNSIAFMVKYPQYKLMFFLLGLLSFIIWLKVATDIFFMFALFYCVDTYSTAISKKAVSSDENSI